MNSRATQRANCDLPAFAVQSGRTAFTLVELLAATAVMALLAGATALSTTGLVAGYRIRAEFEQLVRFERAARHLAVERVAQVQLRYDRRSNTVTRRARGEEKVLKLNKLRIDRSGPLDGSVIDANAPIRIAPNGRSASYELWVDVADERAVRVLVAGRTGKVVFNPPVRRNPTSVNSEGDAW